jgi:O-antigen ligase
VLVAGVVVSLKIALANLILAVAGIGWALEIARGRLRLRSATILPPLGAYLAASLAAVVFSLDPSHSVGELGELITLALVPIVVSLLDQAWWDRLLGGLATVATASSALGLWQYLHGASSLQHRLSGLANHYMTFSGWTLIVILLLVADMAFDRRRYRLLWTAPVCLLCTSALLLSYTRNAWVGLAAGLVLVAVVWKPKALYLYLALTLIAVVMLPRAVIDRVGSIVDLRQPSNYDRLCMMQSGVRMVQDNPLFGVGLGMVERRYPVYREDDAPRWRVPHLHNNLLQIAAERGAVGTAAYIAVLAVFLVDTWRRLRRPGQPHFAAMAGCLLAVSGITVAGLFEYYWGDAEVWILTLTLMAAPYALERPSEEHVTAAEARS